MLESEDKKYLNAVQFYGKRSSSSSPTTNVKSDIRVATEDISSTKDQPHVSFVSDLRSEELDQTQRLEFEQQDNKFETVIKETYNAEELLYTIQGFDFTGTWHTHQLQQGEEIFGIYGYLNSAPNIRGVGFIVWTPFKFNQ